MTADEPRKPHSQEWLCYLSAAFWMNLQTRYDLEVAEDEIAEQVERDVRPLNAATVR